MAARRIVADGFLEPMAALLHPDQRQVELDLGEQRLRDLSRPERVFHLAAEVGGIGANRANPGRYWYANLMMGAHVLELSRERSLDKLVIAGTVCAYPKFAPVPFSEDDLWNGYPEETNAPYGIAKLAQLVQLQANRAQYGQRARPLAASNAGSIVVVMPVILAEKRPPSASPYCQRPCSARAPRPPRC